MGYDPPNFFVASDGHYVQSGNEYLVDEFLYAHGVEHKVGGMIAPGKAQYRYDFKIGDKFVEVWGYEDNRENNKICKSYNDKRKKKEEFYTSLGLTLISIEPDLFDTTHDKLQKRLETVFKKAGVLLDNPPDDFSVENSVKHAYYWSEDRVLDELKKIIKDTNNFPSWGQLKNMGRGDLADAVKVCGGFTKFRNLLGQKTRTDWTEEKIEADLKEIIAKDGKFPIQGRLKELERWDLLRAINRAGGFVNWHIRMGFKPTRAANKNK
jgi:hypothetical protein